RRVAVDAAVAVRRALRHDREGGGLMRFAQAHKAATYGMAASAYLSLVAGGALNPVLTAAGAIGLTLRWWWDAPRGPFDRWAMLWTISSLVVLVAVAALGVTTGDWFGAGGTFLVWLLVAKAFQRKSSKDWQQLHLLSFLMLVAGSVLDPGLAYAASF